MNFDSLILPPEKVRRITQARRRCFAHELKAKGRILKRVVHNCATSMLSRSSFSGAITRFVAKFCTGPDDSVIDGVYYRPRAIRSCIMRLGNLARSGSSGVDVVPV